MSAITISSAAVTLLLANCAATSMEKTAEPAMAKKVANVRCSGINSCKGQSWVKATVADCYAKGGKNLGKV